MAKSPPRKGKGKWATGPQPPDRGAIVPQGSRQGNFQPPNTNGGDDLLVKQATDQAYTAAGVSQPTEGEQRLAKLRTLVQAAESTYTQYGGWVQKGWQRAYRAFGNRHFDGSKYLAREFKARSSLFVPKTRSAVRKTMAANAASLFSTTDAMAISPGNEGDPNSRAGAALIQEVVNYRTDRTSGRNAIKWFLTCMGCVQDATLTGICISKQFWKLETKQVGERPMMRPGPDTDPMTGEPVMMDVIDGETGEPVMEPIIKPIVDRPESVGIPPDQIIIDAGADWRDPVQSAAFLGIRWPMTVDDILERQKSLHDPWNEISEDKLKTYVSSDGGNATVGRGVRNAREGGRDRYDQANRPQEFGTVWVTEWYVRMYGEDLTFFTVGNGELFLKDPLPTEEVYAWNQGERPVTMGYGSLESHKIFPMSPAESWQPTQVEINDVANLTLDTVKQNIAPITVVKRGANVDLDALRRRGPGTNVLADKPDDIVFSDPPGVDAGAWQLRERLNNDFDSLAGQFDQSSVATNRSLNETVGGMKILTGAANALGEFDQRIIIETWAEPALAQIVRLCQYYEHDETILALCGDRAQLWQKHGVNQITDQMMDAQVTTRIDIGVGAGDPQQRLAKFQMATGVLLPLMEKHPDFASGKIKLNVEAMFQEAFGAAGYRDGGKRFIAAGDQAQGQPQENPEVAKIKGELQLKKEAQDAKIAMEREAAQHKMALEREMAAHTATLQRKEARVKALIERENAQNRLANETETSRAKIAADVGVQREGLHKNIEVEREKATMGHGLEREKFQAGHGLEREKAIAGHGLQREMADKGHELETVKAEKGFQLEAAKATKGHELERDKASKGHDLEREKAGKGHELERERFDHDRTLADERFKSEENRAEGKFKGDEGRAERKAKLDEKVKTAKSSEKASKEKSAEAKIAEVKKETAELQAAVVDALKEIGGDKEIVRDKSGKAVGTRRARKPKDNG